MLIFLRQKCKIDLLIFTFFISVLQLSVLSIQSFNFQFLSMQDSVKPQLWAVVNVTERMLFLFLFFINYGIKRKKKIWKKEKENIFLIFLINIGLIIVLEALKIELEIVVNIDHKIQEPPSWGGFFSNLPRDSPLWAAEAQPAVWANSITLSDKPIQTSFC